MVYSYNIIKTKVENHNFYVVKSNNLKGCVAQGETLVEALALFAELEKEWLETAKKYNISIPEINSGGIEMRDKFNPFGGKIPTDAEAEKDLKLMAKLISEICDYAVDNGMNPTDTIKAVANNLLTSCELSNFDNWHKEN